jgi:CheY-like chemotaxis protein
LCSNWAKQEWRHTISEADWQRRAQFDSIKCFAVRWSIAISMKTIWRDAKQGEIAVEAPASCGEPLSPCRCNTILLVEDEDVCRITTKWFLANFGYHVVPTRSAEEALARFVPETHDVVVTDNDIPGLSGAELAHIIKLRSPATPVIMYTGQPPADTSCLDRVIDKQSHLLRLKEAIDELVAIRPPVTGTPQATLANQL